MNPTGNRALSCMLTTDGGIRMEKSAVKITVTYDDGSTKDLEKGLVWSLTDKPGTGQVEVTAEMVAVSGKDLYTVVEAAVELGMRLGMFRGLEDDDD